MARFREQLAVLSETLRTPTSLYERNARYVMIDGMGVGLVTGVATFLSVFLARLGASNVLVGLLTAMPAVTGALTSIPLGHFLGARRNPVVWYARSRILVLSSYALTGLMPFFFPADTTIWAIIVIWAVATVPQTMTNILFTLVMTAVAGPSRRLSLMSRRWATLGITNAISVALVGLVLGLFNFPVNYQIVFIFSFVGGLISYTFSTNIVLPEERVAAAEASPNLPWHAAARRMARLFVASKPFARFVGSQFVFRCGMAMAIPLFPLYWVRTVGASDSAIGLINTVQSSVLLIAYTLWIAVARRRGGAFVLIFCAFGIALYPLATALTMQVWPLLIFAAFAGLFSAGSDLVIFDVAAATAPAEARGAAIGVYHTTNYIATFVAPLIGTAAAQQVGIGTMLIVAAMLRLAGGLMFLLLRVGHDEGAAQETEGTQRAQEKGRQGDKVAG